MGTYSIEDLLGDSTAAPTRPTPRTRAARYDLDALLGDSTTPAAPAPARDTTGRTGDVDLSDGGRIPPRPAPARGRGIGERIASLLGQVGDNVGPERIGGQGLYDPATEEHRRLAVIPDRRTVLDRQVEQGRAEAARQETMAAHTKLAQQGVFGGGMGGYVKPPDVAAAEAAPEDAANRRRFSPAQWRDVAKRGMQLAGKMNAEAVALRATDPDAAEARHQQAEDVSRKAYNAQLVADGAADADTPDAIALSSLVGFIHDPTAGSKRNLAEARADPTKTFTPEEQSTLLGKNLPVSVEREADPYRDLAIPMAASLPLFIGGDLAVARGARAGAEALGLEATGARGALARGLGRAAEIGVPEEAVPPQPGLAGVKRDLAAFVEAIPTRARRGAMIGQVPGAVIAGREAQQMDEDVTPAVVGSIVGNAIMGAAGEIALPGVGLAASAPRRLLTEGLQNMAVEAAQEGRSTLARTLYRLGEDAFERADPRVRTRARPTPAPAAPVAPEIAAPVEQAREQAGKLPLADQTAEGQHATLAKMLGRVLAEKENAPTFGSDVGLIERDPGYLSPRPEPADVNPPLRSARDLAMERTREPGAPEPRDEANAMIQMQRAAEEQRAIEAQQAADAEQARVEQATLVREAERMGPLTLRETIEQAARDRDEGVSVAGEYHDAIGKFADVQARMQDASGEGKTPSAKLRLDYARAKATLNEMRRKYGTALGAAALLTLASHDGDLSDDERKWLGIGGALAATTAVTRHIPIELRDRALAAMRNAGDATAHAQAWLNFIASNDAPFGEHYPLLKDAMARLSEEYGENIPADAVREAITRMAGAPGEEPVPAKFTSRLARAVETLQGKAWDQPRPAADWIGKLKGLNTFSKAEFALIEPVLREAQETKTKLTRAKVLEIVEAKSPNIEMVRLSRVEPPAPPTPEPIRPLDELPDDATQPEIEAQAEARRERIRELQVEIESEHADANNEAEAAQRNLDSQMRDLRNTLDRFPKVRARREEIANEIARILEEAIDEGSNADVAARAAFDVARDAGAVVQTEPNDPYTDRDLRIEESDNGVTVHSFLTGQDYTEPTLWEALARAEHAGGWEPGSTDYILPRGFTVREEVMPATAEPRWVLRSQAGTVLDHSMAGESRAEFVERYVRGTFAPVADEWASDMLRDEIYYTLNRLHDLMTARRRRDAIGDLPQIIERESAINDLNDELTQLRERWENAAPSRGGEPEPEPEPFDPYTAPVEHTPSGGPEYASYQRIGGGRDYAELLNVHTNPDEAYSGGHYKYAVPGTVGWARVETHDVPEVPGLTGPTIEYPKDEPEPARIIRSQIAEVRQKIATEENAATAIVREMEALPPAETTRENASPRARDLVSRYDAAARRIKDLALRETELTDKIVARLGLKKLVRTIRVMLESQSDYAQDAGKFGIRRELTPDELAARDAERDRLNAMRDEQMRRDGELATQREAMRLAWEATIDRAVAEGRLTDADEVARPHFLTNERLAQYDLHDRTYYQAVRDRMLAADPHFRDIIDEWEANRAEYRQLAIERDNTVRAIGAHEARYSNDTNAVPPGFYADTKTAHALNVARALGDAADGGYEFFAWSDASNRMQNAHLPFGAAKLTYNEIIPSHVKSILGWLGFKNVPIEHVYIRGYGHWMIRLTPEMRRAIRKIGVPALGVLGALATQTEDAQAETAKAGGEQVPTGAGALYATLGGAVAGGAALAAMMRSKSLRALVKATPALARGLFRDDVSGLAGRRAFARAVGAVDREPSMAWVVADAAKLAEMRRVEGPQAADRALARIGRIVRDAAEAHDVPMQGYRAGPSRVAVAVPQAVAADVLAAIERDGAFAGVRGTHGASYLEAEALLHHDTQSTGTSQANVATAQSIAEQLAGAGRTGRDANARPYARRSVEGTRQERVLGRDVRIAAEHTPDPSFVAQHAQGGYIAPTMLELAPGDRVNAETFHAAISAARDATPYGSAVYVYSPEEYAGMRLYTSGSGKTGFALKGDDIVSVFSTEKGGRAAHALAIAEGGRTLDAFDTVLPSIYASNGMRVVSRLPWDDSQAPPDWSYDTFKKFNGGRPDVVFMVYDPAFTGDRLAGDRASSYDEAVQLQQAAKLRGESGGESGVTLYANPIGPALGLLRKSPSVAGLAVVGALATQQDNEYVRRTGVPIIALAALHAIGARRIGAGVDNLAQGLVDQLRRTQKGTAVARFFNPDRLVSPEVRAAVRTYERAKSAATAQAAHGAAVAKRLGPQGDRAVSDVLDREAWEGMAAQTPDVLAVALQYADDYDAATKAQLAAGTLAPEQVLPNYGGPRKYAHYEVAHALADKPGARGGTPPSPRIAKTNVRTLDIPIREAERALTEAKATGDAAKIQAATEALDEAQYHSYAQRLERGEIREASYRYAAGIEKAYQNVAAAKLFESLKATPGVAHPEWVQAVTDYQTATALARAATTQADKDATKIMVGDAAAHLDELKRRYSQKGTEYVALPDSPSWGMLRGAIVQRDVAHSLEGFGHPDTWGKLLRAWKEVHTVFNVGTHVGNILSNVVALHVGDVPMWLQPKYYKLALKDLESYGDGARALTEAGVMHLNVVTADGAPATAASMRSAEGLEQLLPTTRPETAEVIRRESEQNSAHAITEPAIAARAASRRATGAAIGAAVGGAKGYDDEHPERALVGAGIGAGLGALVASGLGDQVRRLYGHEDNLARIAIYLRNRDLGKTHAEAVQAGIAGLADFRTRSPALRVTSRYLSPFILYQAKAVPAFAAKIIDHPWKWLTLVAAWGALNEYSKAEVGEIPEQDRDERDRATWGYFFPGMIQLPITNERGDKGATDMARYTPFGGFATGAPPGSVPEAFSGNAPQVATPGGPFIDAALRLSNVEPFTKKPLFERDLPPERNIATALHELSDFMLPSALGFHAEQLQRDYDNRDWDKMKNDLLGPMGTKPRFIRKGAAGQRAAYELDRDMRAMKQRLRQELRANKNPSRVPSLISRALEEAAAAAEAYKRRATPPTPGTRP